MSSAVLHTAEHHTPSVALRADVAIGMLLTACVVFINEAVFRNNDVEQFSADWQVALRLLICACCGLYGLYFLPQTLQNIWRFPAVLSLLFGFWALATVPRAVDPKYAAAAACALWCVLLFAPAALLRVGPRRLVHSVIFALGLFLVGSHLAYYLMPDVGRTVQTITGGDQITRLGGLSHPNGLGRQAAMFIAMVLLAVVRYGFPRRWAAPLIAFAGYTLLLTDSRTAMIAAAAGTLVALRSKLSWLLRPAVWTSLIALAATALLVVAAAGLVDFDLDKLFAHIARNGEAEEIYSLTGRSEVWQFALGNIAQRPLFGFGYGCSRFVMVHNFFATHHAHNLLLNVGLSAGLVGSLLVASMLGVLLWRAATAASGFPDVIAVLICVGGIADYVMLGPIPDCHTLLFFVALHWGGLAAPQRDGVSVGPNLAHSG